MGKRLHPQARHIYLGNDELHTIGAADYAVRTLDRVAAKMDTVILLARSMANTLPSNAHTKAFFVAHGLDPSLETLATLRPMVLASMWCRLAPCCLTRTSLWRPDRPSRP